MSKPTIHKNNNSNVFSSSHRNEMKKVEGRKPSFSSAESAEGENERSSKPAGMLGRDQSSSSVSSNSRVPSREKGTGLRVLRKTSEKSTSVKKSKQEREKVDRRTSIPDTGSSRADFIKIRKRRK